MSCPGSLPVVIIVGLAKRSVKMAEPLRDADVGDSDNKFDQIYRELKFERRETLSLANRLEIKVLGCRHGCKREHSKYHEFQRLEPFELDLQYLMADLTSRFRTLDRILNNVNPHGYSRRIMGMRMKALCRWLLLEQEFDHLKRTLTSITDLRKRLDTLLTHIRPCDDFSDSAQVDVLDTGIPSLGSSFKDSLAISHMAHQLPEQIFDLPIPLSHAHRIGLDAFRSIQKASRLDLAVAQDLGTMFRLEAKRIARLDSKLTLWGAGAFHDDSSLFHSELDLDKLLPTPAGQRHSTLWTFIMRNLINILISELSILDIMVANLPHTSPYYTGLLKNRSEILLILANEEFTEMLTQRYEEMFPSWDDAASGSDGLSDDSEFCMSETSQIELLIEDIEVSIETLYTILPSISSCRQSHALDLEAFQQQQQQQQPHQAHPTTYKYIINSFPDSSTWVQTPSRTSSIYSQTLPSPQFSNADTHTPSTTISTSINVQDLKQTILENLGITKKLASIFLEEEMFYRQKKKPIREFATDFQEEAKKLELCYRSLDNGSYDCSHVSGDESMRMVAKTSQIQTVQEQNKLCRTLLDFMLNLSEPAPLRKTMVPERKGEEEYNDVEVQIDILSQKIEMLLKEFRMAGPRGLFGGGRGKWQEVSGS
ncbi:hypothetical protein QBC38DRAFT_149197 [Podospora fimiseda]|uniref:Uncharacterized protein n=1 Tax=Podospora fimiseda TaxID=252190 RepID=A0AAN6YL36_9PEZI|nr:hypothetical protein QBC38DRAFT_149197 [Podospora fimiseda]